MQAHTQAPSNPFLAALAAKAKAVQADYKAAYDASDCEAIKANMKKAAKLLPQLKANNLLPDETKEVAQEVSITVLPDVGKTEVMDITIDVVSNRNRLDIYFAAKPDADTLDALKAQGFHFRPSDKAWYHQDNTENREFLNAEFGAGLEIETETTPEVEPEVVEVEPVETKSEYHRIIDALCEYYKESPADVCVRAVKLLHSETF